MRVLVTGHSGYIGPHAVELLRDAGHEAIGVDLNLFAESEIYPMARPHEDWTLDVFDLRPQHFAGVDAVIHLAAISNDAMGLLDPELTWRVNYEGTLHVARCAKLAGVGRFLFSSSCSVYGKSGAVAATETAPLEPLSVYAQTKVEAEKGLSAMADDQFSPVFLRNATAYGVSPRFRTDLVVNNLLASACATGEIELLSDGTAWRPLIHCRDIARAFVLLLTASRALVHNEAFNIGSAKETYQIREVARIVQEVLPACEITVAEGATSDARDYRVDFGKLETRFPEFQLRSTLKAGARELHDHVRRYRLGDSLLAERFVRLKSLRRRLVAARVPEYFLQPQTHPQLAVGSCR